MNKIILIMLMSFLLLGCATNRCGITEEVTELETFYVTDSIIDVVLDDINHKK